MSNTRLAAEKGPGLFYITSVPKKGHEKDYHEWYNTEHGPLRLKLDFVMNGYRYRSLEHELETFLAAYDVDRLDGFSEKRYIDLRENRSRREQYVLDNKVDSLDRRFFKLLSSRGDAVGPAEIIMVVIFVVKDEYVEEMRRWYDEEHSDDISKIPGWHRSRRYQLVDADNMREGYTELLAIHDFAKVNGIGGAEHETAKSRPWRTKILDLVESRDNKLYEFYHEFKPKDYRAPTA